MQLLFFHAYLVYEGLTTYDFIMLKAGYISRSQIDSRRERSQAARKEARAPPRVLVEPTTTDSVSEFNRLPPRRLPVEAATSEDPAVELRSASTVRNEPAVVAPALVERDASTSPAIGAQALPLQDERRAPAATELSAAESDVSAFIAPPELPADNTLMVRHDGSESTGTGGATSLPSLRTNVLNERMSYDTESQPSQHQAVALPDNANIVGADDVLVNIDRSSVTATAGAAAGLVFDRETVVAPPVGVSAGDVAAARGSGSAIPLAASVHVPEHVGSGMTLIAPAGGANDGVMTDDDSSRYNISVEEICI
jgi:hypothetical protein